MNGRFVVSLLSTVAILAACPLASQELSLAICDPDPMAQPRTAADQGLVAAITAPTANFRAAEPFEDLLGGAATLRMPDGAEAFSQPGANLSFDRAALFGLGNRDFNNIWIAAPASTGASDGLGPLYNARSCQACHIKDGRGHPPEPGEPALSLVLHLSLPDPGSDDPLAAIPDPIYGSQLQGFAVEAILAEVDLQLTYEEVSVSLWGNDLTYLRSPSYGIVALSYGPLGDQARFSPRVAPPGLLDLLAHASDAHVFNHPPTQRGGLLLLHRNLLSDRWEDHNRQPGKASHKAQR